MNVVLQDAIFNIFFFFWCLTFTRDGFLLYAGVLRGAINDWRFLWLKNLQFKNRSPKKQNIK